MIDVFYPIPKLLDTILTEIYAENRRKHEERMAELQVISNSSLRDAYAQQLLLDRFLAPVENAQHSIQNAAKHAQYMAEVVNYYHRDHGCSQEQAQEISRQFRALAVKISQIDSLYDLKIIYQVVTVFTQQLSRFKHRERNYSWEREIRKGILNPLNTCIAVEKNFQRRVAFMTGEPASAKVMGLLESE
ncbi:hypothetical protein [Microcystis aeruginosa]|uniref:Uncharacterized protein n=3 Tax=Microcystis TaxID=1125 RepID=A0A6H9GKM0_MICAE|nr:hypothetical protein [Microcystis aeruginosa]BAG00488.1 hypothetical protein MAE_06660 [Microcystis aeruginosa NIES-843]GCL48140.1 hypothetical protein NIES3787_38540 [Microcystis aeruginosa NIES-3787]